MAVKKWNEEAENFIILDKTDVDKVFFLANLVGWLSFQAL